MRFSEGKLDCAISPGHAKVQNATRSFREKQMREANNQSLTLNYGDSRGLKQLDRLQPLRIKRYTEAG
jgi:hypothetical protein